MRGKRCSVVGRGLQAHWIHVRSPRSVRGVRQTVRWSHGHLVGHRRRGHSLGGSSGSVVERRCPWVELVDWRVYRQCCWPGLFGGSERSLTQIVKGLGRRGEIIRVVRGSTVVWAVMSSGLGKVERFGQWEEVRVVHRAAGGGHRHGFHGGRLLRCQESFLSFIFFVLLLWFAGGVVVLVGLGVRFTALNKNCGGSIYRQSVTIHPPSSKNEKKSYQLHRAQIVLPVCAPSTFPPSPPVSLGL